MVKRNNFVERLMKRNILDWKSIKWEDMLIRGYVVIKDMYILSWI